MNKEYLNKFIDGVIKNENDDMASAHQFSVEKVKAIIAEFKNDKVKKLHESIQRVLLEYNDKTGMHMEMEPHTGIITVNGKQVGKVVTNMDDFESGINFVSMDGNFSKEFNTTEDLSKFLYTTYGVK